MFRNSSIGKGNERKVKGSNTFVSYENRVRVGCSLEKGINLLA